MDSASYVYREAHQPRYTVYGFTVAVARHLHDAQSKTYNARIWKDCLLLAGGLVRDFLASERIVFGDDNYEWNFAAAGNLAREEMEHWESA